MSSLKPVEKRLFEDLFGMSSGYVLDFTNATFAEFFRDIADTDIYKDEFAIHGDSKAKRLRAFWELKEDTLVSTVLDELLDIWEFSNDTSGGAKAKIEKCRSIVSRLGGKSTPKQESDSDFLQRAIELPDLALLKADPIFTKVLSDRLVEVEKCLRSGASLSVIFMCGSILEGVLLYAALSDPRNFNAAKASPKDRNGNVRKLHEWSLSQFVDVACELQLIKVDVKKFSHSLRDFRNYIHPYQQLQSGFTPDKHTAEISFQVLKAALADLSNTR